MIQKGDRVTIEAGMAEGQTGTVIELDQGRGLATVEVEMFGERREKRVMLDDLSAHTDDPAEVRASVVGKVRQILGEPYERHRRHWWARRAHEEPEPSPRAMREFQSFRDELDESFEAAVAAEIEAMERAVDADDADAIRAWFSGRRDELESRARREARRAVEGLCHELFTVEEIEEAKRRAREAPERSDLLSDEDLEEQALNDLAGDLIDRGLRLWDESQKAADAAGRQYAYDEIGAGPVDLDYEAPKDDVADEEVHELHGPTGVEAELGAGEALARLRQADAAPLEALRTLAVEQPDGAVEALQSKRRSLRQGTEGATDRYDFIADIDVTLVAFDRPELWRGAIDRHVGGSAEIDADLEGLTTRDGELESFGDNPWGVGSGGAVDDLLHAVWQPLEQRLPNAVLELRRRVLAVAMVDDGEGPRLRYLVIRPHSSDRLRERGVERGHPGSFETDALPAWIGFGSLAVLEGGAPGDVVDVRLANGRTFQLPMALREFRSRHADVGDGEASVGAEFHSLAEWADDSERFRRQNGGASPDRFVAFGRDGHGNAYVFDRDRLDTRNDPLVAAWDSHTLEVGERRPFWTYLDGHLREMIGA